MGTIFRAKERRMPLSAYFNLVPPSHFPVWRDGERKGKGVVMGREGYGRLK